MRRSWLALVLMLLLAGFVANVKNSLAQEAGPGEAEPPAMDAEGVPPEPEGEPTEEAAEEKKEPEAGVSVLQLVMKHSSWPGWTIIGMSVIAFYLVLRFLWYLRRSRFMPSQLVEALQEDISNRRIREAVEKCRDDDSVLASVVGSGLAEVRSGYDSMVGVMGEVGEEESVRLNQQVGWLALIGAISPMLGLTGTVLGMMGAFGTISQMETQPPPRLLAAHLQTALVTTFEGLVVAVPVLLAYAIFRNRVTTLMLEVGVESADLIGQLKGVELTPAMTAGVSEAARKSRKEPSTPPPPPPEE